MDTAGKQQSILSLRAHRCPGGRDSLGRGPGVLLGASRNANAQAQGDQCADGAPTTASAAQAGCETQAYASQAYAAGSGRTPTRAVASKATGAPRTAQAGLAKANASRTDTAPASDTAAGQGTSLASARLQRGEGVRQQCTQPRQAERAYWWLDQADALHR